LEEKVPVISIVDDDESVSAALRSLVRSLGLVAHAFASAEEFLQSAHLDETACLISDIQMQGMSGVDLQMKLASDGRLIPIIFITAFPKDSVRAHVLEAGAICFLHKPFDGQALIQCIESALGKSVVGRGNI
jgi:FixJ family two-component response regulator